MSPYEFTSKTHSLSTEDLGKFFVDSSFNTMGTFYLKQKTPVKWRKITRNLAKIKWKIVLPTVAM